MRSCLAPETGRNLSACFFGFNDYYSAKAKHTDPKLVWLEPSGHEESEYVRTFFELVCERNDNSKCPHILYTVSLYGEISICVPLRVLASDTSASALDRRT